MVPPAVGRIRIPAGKLPYVPAMMTNAFGIYVHWPFCLSKCPYCDFNSHVRHAAIDEARFVRAFAAEIAATAARVPGRTVSTIFFGGGTPSLMQPATVGAVLDAIAQQLVGRPRRRGDARGQSDQRRGHAFPRLSRRRRQSRLARRPGPGRCGAQGAGAAAYRARSARRGRRRARDLRSLFIRSHLCAAGPDARRLGDRAPARHRGSGRASLALSAHHRAGHAVFRAARGGQAHRSRRRCRPRALRHDAGGLRRRGPSGLRDFQPRAAGRGMPAQSRLLARARMGRRRARRPRPARHRGRAPRHRDGEAAGGVADAGRSRSGMASSRTRRSCRSRWRTSFC